MQINDFDKVHVQHHLVYVSKDIEWSTADARELRDKSFTIVLGMTDHQNTHHPGRNSFHLRKMDGIWNIDLNNNKTWSKNKRDIFLVDNYNAYLSGI